MQARLRAFSQLVILLGPPCAGKTTYYQQEYELKGFTRTSLPIDGDEQTVGEILDKLFESLKHKGKVVLDDEQFNTNHDARQGLIDKVKSSIKNIEISVVNIAPTGGKIQCLWASEFAIAGTLILSFLTF
jgi:tRNA uridine 5-carbamoylmethylation protein Kti12